MLNISSILRYTAQDAPRILKAGSPKRFDSSFTQILPILRLFANFFNEIKGVILYSGSF